MCASASHFLPLITAELMGKFYLSSLEVGGGQFRLLQVKICDKREDKTPEISALREIVVHAHNHMGHQRTHL